MSGIDVRSLTDQRALGQLLTRVEKDPQFAQAVLADLPRPACLAHRIGVTGSPGVGKSTLLGRLVELLRTRNERVAVLAVDPTSPLTGGALLGDRLRVAPQRDDSGLFIRSLPSRSSLGGIAPAAGAFAAILEAAGYQRILVETAGVGQTGFDVAWLTDTVLVLFSPEGGDALQVMKAGLLEVGDVLAVNKADRPDAEVLQHELEFAVRTAMQPVAAGPEPPARWQPPVLLLTATSGQGTPELLTVLDRHREWLGALPPSCPRRGLRLARELSYLVRSSLEEQLAGPLADSCLELAARVVTGQLDRDAAVRELCQRLLRSLSE